jgi:hypothetical protein
MDELKRLAEELKCKEKQLIIITDLMLTLLQKDPQTVDECADIIVDINTLLRKEIEQLISNINSILPNYKLKEDERE